LGCARVTDLAGLMQGNKEAHLRVELRVGWDGPNSHTMATEDPRGGIEGR
jgi:hypothetical protein